MSPIKTDENYKLLEVLSSAKNKIHDIREQQASSLESEVQSITERSTKLFPQEFTLNEDTTELFRAMCILSQCTIREPKIIQSHRPIIGKLIVLSKKITWKLVEPQLRNVLAGIQDCFTWLITSHAKLIVQVKELETKLEKLDKPQSDR